MTFRVTKWPRKKLCQYSRGLAKSLEYGFIPLHSEKNRILSIITLNEKEERKLYESHGTVSFILPFLNPTYFTVMLSVLSTLDYTLKEFKLVQASAKIREVLFYQVMNCFM